MLFPLNVEGNENRHRNTFNPTTALLDYMNHFFN